MVAADPSGLTLVTGPASSGKSRWAEHLASDSGLPVLYLATGPQRRDDADWQSRIERHRARRPHHWSCLEVGFGLAAALRSAPAETLVLVDSLGTWVAAGLELDERLWLQQVSGLEAALQHHSAPLILVGEETAWGVVPPTRIGHLFRQRLAALMQQLMPRCDAAWLVLHGRALDLLSLSQPLPPAALPHSSP